MADFSPARKCFLIKAFVLKSYRTVKTSNAKIPPFAHRMDSAPPASGSGEEEDICDVEPPNCDFSDRFRTIDGTCNNPVDPTLGSRNTPFARFCPAEYVPGTEGEPLGFPAVDLR